MKNNVRKEIKKQDLRNQIVAAAAIGVALGRKREVRYLQPYYYQGGKWYKLNTRKGA